MELSKLSKIKGQKRPKKRVGRGMGSGRGKTAGRGTKGQKARGKVNAWFEGGQLKLIKRLPFRRGIGNAPASKAFVINVSALNVFSPGEEITITRLQKENLFPKKLPKKGVKK